MPRSLLAAVLAVRLFDEANAFVLPGTFESLRADIGLTYSQASSSFVAIAVGAVAGTATTVAADYRSRRVICSAGAVGYAASLVVIGVAASYPVVLVGAFLVGVASTAMVDASEVALADLAGDDLERHLTTQNALGSIGDLLGPALVVGALALGLSWRICFFAAGVLVALYGAWVATLRFPPPHPRDDGHSVRGAVRSVASDPVVWLAGSVTMLLGPLDEPLLAFLIAHLEHARGLTAAGATLIASFSVAGAFVGYATLRRRDGLLPADATLLAAAVSGLVVAPGPVVASVASLLVGTFLVRVWIDVQARVLTVRPGQAGTVKAVVTVVETIGWVLPLLAGAVADRVDVTAGLASYAAIAWALAAAAALLHRAARSRRGAPVRPGEGQPAGPVRETV
ncbi:MAG TPA: MFS transporter [Acidimicrobiales bacterium]